MRIRIDPHVHCRDGGQAYKETIAHVFQIAEQQGVTHIFDMPNTDPPILTEKDVHERFALVPETKKRNYFLYLGLTPDEEQLEQAVVTFDRLTRVIGFKLYAGKSVGDLEVIEEEQQKKIYAILTALEYEGVIAVHCEKKSELKPDLWDFSNPISHSWARPKEAEVASIQDQIRFVKDTGFQGNLHIVHVSCPESVELIDSARKEINITCGVTPHHVMWDNRRLSESNGLLYKMNPPLRNQSDVLGLTECLKAGKIDWIETDHAPHPYGEKLHSSNPPSGYPSLYLYKDFVEKFLPGLGINGEEIRKLTHDNICRTFRLNI